MPFFSTDKAWAASSGKRTGFSSSNPSGRLEMKRPASWEESLAISSDDSSNSESEGDETGRTRGNSENQGSQLSKDIMSEAPGTAANARKKRYGVVDYEALSKHGYRGGPSVLKVPPPKVEEKEQDWSWSTGKHGGNEDDNNTIKESYEEREKTRASATQCEKLLNFQTNLPSSGRDKKNQSFAQKEKRKRDLGQASRGKNYVEEEKRLLRENGIYSGFDS